MGGRRQHEGNQGCGKGAGLGDQLGKERCGLWPIVGAPGSPAWPPNWVEKLQSSHGGLWHMGLMLCLSS